MSEICTSSGEGPSSGDRKCWVWLIGTGNGESSWSRFLLLKSIFWIPQPLQPHHQGIFGACTFTGSETVGSTVLEDSLEESWQSQLSSTFRGSLLCFGPYLLQPGLGHGNNCFPLSRQLWLPTALCLLSLLELIDEYHLPFILHTSKARPSSSSNYPLICSLARFKPPGTVSS